MATANRKQEAENCRPAAVLTIKAMNTSDLIREFFAVFHARDRAAAEVMLSGDFTFSSPLDDKINKAAYFDRCWPNGDHQASFELERVFSEGAGGFVTYSCSRLDGTPFRNTEFFRTSGDQITQVEVYFGAETAADGQEEELRALMDEVAGGIRAKDGEAMVARYADDVIAYDLIKPLQYHGRGEVKRRADQWLSSWIGAIEFEMRDLVFSVGTESAFCHNLNHVRGTRQEGGAVDMWWRATNCFRKREGKWLITHIHSSVPFDMETGKASMSLAPES